MSNSIIIINYGIGNLTSVANMLKKAGADKVIISNDINEIENADKLILPGVGHFDYGMKKLIESNLIPMLEKKVLLDKTPILGICLGAQLMTKSSEEGQGKGLGWLDAQTIAFDKSKLDEKMKIPHMGWNYIAIKKQVSLADNLPENSRFYFVHSFHLQMNNMEDIWLTTNYGYEFTVAYQRGNIFATQFHPEKSHKFGMQLMRNFVNI